MSADDEPKKSDDLVVYAAQEAKDLTVSVAKGAGKVTVLTAEGTARLLSAAVSALRPKPAPVSVHEPPRALPVAQAPPTLQQPVNVYINNSQRHATLRQTNGVATFALCLGVLVLCFSVIPFLGLLTIPFGAATLILAAIGFLIALARGGAGLGSSMLAAVLAVLSFGLMLASTGAVLHEINKHQPPPPVAEATDDQTI